MMDENKPRPRRRGGRARAQNTGGVLANLHGINIAVEESDGGGGGAGKKSTMRLKKGGVGGLLPTMPDATEAKPTMPLTKVSKSTVNQDRKAVSKSLIPSRAEKENTVNIYTSPDAAMPSSSLSPVQTASPTPPCSSVKVKSNSDVNDEARRILFSPLSASSPSCDDSVQSNSECQDDDSDDECNSAHSDEVDAGIMSVDDDAGTRTDASEDSALDVETSDIDDASDQQEYGDDDGDNSILSQDDESEDEDYSIDDDSYSSNSDDEFEFEEDESDKKQRKEGRKRGVDKDAKIEDSCGNAEIDGNDAANEDIDHEPQTSPTNQLRVCKVNLNDILGTEEDVYDDGLGGEIADDFGDEVDLDGPVSENVSVSEEPELQVSSPQQIIPAEPLASESIAPESNPAPSPALPSTSEIHNIVDRLFREADKDTVTRRNIIQAVAAHFTLPTLEKSMKTIIKRRLTDLLQGNCGSAAEDTNIHRETRCDEVGSENDAPDAVVWQDEKMKQTPPSIDVSKGVRDIGDDCKDRNDARGIAEQDLPISPAPREILEQVDDQLPVSTDQDEYIVGQYMLPVNEQPIDEAPVGDGDDSILIHCLSPEVSVKSTASGKQYESTHLVDSMSMPDENIQQDLHISSAAADLSQHVDHQLTVSTESKAASIHGHYLPTVNESTSIDDVGCDDSILFQHLSPDVSVKSRSLPGDHHSSAHHVDAMSMSGAFRDPSKSACDDTILFQNLSPDVSVKSRSVPGDHHSSANHADAMSMSGAFWDPSKSECDDSILFQNLSPDVSVKSRSVPGDHHSSANHADAMSMSGTFRDTSKSRSVVEKGKWSLGSQIGAGSFGRVYTGMNAINGSIMAVKVLHIPSENKRAIVEDLQREIDLMKSLKHRNIVRYLGAEVDNAKNILNIFQEWVPGGCISTLLKKFGPFSINVVKSYLAQILDGLDYLHCHGIIHRDIKGGNILVSNDGAIKLADFGASKRIEAFGAQSDMMELSMRGTPYFMAPEVFEEKFGFKADIWSVGGVIYQMITGSPPWKGMGLKSPVALFMHIKSHDRPPSLPRLTECNPLDFARLEKILAVCFLREPSMRPSASALKSHQFLNESIDHTPESPNLTQNHDRLSSLSPIGAAFLESPTSLSPSSDDTTNGNEALSTTLADSLCFSLTMTCPFPKLNAREPTDTSSWPDWAKRCDKVNASQKVAENKEGNPYAKKAPLTRRCLEGNTDRKSISVRDADADSMATK